MATTMTPGAWTEVPADETSDAIVAAMGLGGVEYLFFTSGSEIMFYQEAIAKAKAQGKPTPKLITMTHEHPSLNAAIGYGMVTGKPAATAAHVDVGTQHYGGAVHTAFRGGVPVLITAGGPPTSYPGTMRGSRDGAHFWLQQGFDQNGIVRQYMKWDHSSLAGQPRPDRQPCAAGGAVRAAGARLPEPAARGGDDPVDNAHFPTVEQLGLARPASPDPDAIRQAAEWLVQARNPAVVVSRSGRNPAAVTALVRAVRATGLAGGRVGVWRTYQSFLFDHPLYQGPMSLKDCRHGARPGGRHPVAARPQRAASRRQDRRRRHRHGQARRFPTYEFTANLRITSDAATRHRGAAGGR